MRIYEMLNKNYINQQMRDQSREKITKFHREFEGTNYNFQKIPADKDIYIIVNPFRNKKASIFFQISKSLVKIIR